MIADIRALNPKPAAGYDNDNAACIIPDVLSVPINRAII